MSLHNSTDEPMPEYADTEARLKKLQAKLTAAEQEAKQWHESSYANLARAESLEDKLELAEQVNDNLESWVIGYKDMVKNLKVAAGQMAAALEYVEWRNRTPSGCHINEQCPSCQRYKGSAHRDDCQLNKALAAWRECAESKNG